MQSILAASDSGARVAQSIFGEPERPEQASSSTASPAERVPVEVIEYFFKPIVQSDACETNAQTLERFRRASALSLVCRKWHRPAVAAFWHKYELVSDPRAPGQYPLRLFDRAFLEGPALERFADAIVALRHVCEEVRSVRLCGGEAFEYFFIKPVRAPPLVHLSDVSGSVSSSPLSSGWGSLVEMSACLDAMAVALPRLTSVDITISKRAASWAAQPRCSSPLPSLRLKKLRIKTFRSVVPPDAVARLFASLDLAHLEELYCDIGSGFNAFADGLPHCTRLRRLEVRGVASSLFARSSGGAGGFLSALSALSTLEHVVISAQRTSVVVNDEDGPVPAPKLDAVQVARVLAALPPNVQDVALFLNFFPEQLATHVALNEFIAERCRGALKAFEWAEAEPTGRRLALGWILGRGEAVELY
ncbi:hypothetical protein JCM9279_005742 [Rhodotorula babjevae]